MRETNHLGKHLREATGAGAKKMRRKLATIPAPCPHALLLDDGRCARCLHQTRSMEPDAHEEALARHYGDLERNG